MSYSRKPLDPNARRGIGSLADQILGIRARLAPSPAEPVRMSDVRMSDVYQPRGPRASKSPTAADRARKARKRQKASRRANRSR